MLNALLVDCLTHDTPRLILILSSPAWLRKPAPLAALLPASWGCPCATGHPARNNSPVLFVSPTPASFPSLPAFIPLNSSALLSFAKAPPPPPSCYYPCSSCLPACRPQSRRSHAVAGSAPHPTHLSLASYLIDMPAIPAVRRTPPTNACSKQSAPTFDARPALGSPPACCRPVLTLYPATKRLSAFAQTFCCYSCHALCSARLPTLADCVGPPTHRTLVLPWPLPCRGSCRPAPQACKVHLSTREGAGAAKGCAVDSTAMAA